MFTLVSLRRSASGKAGTSRSVLATLVALAIGAASVNAQELPGRETVPAAGTSAPLVALVGAILAANSGESVTIQDPFFGATTKISARSNAKLYTGLGVAGFGGVLIYLGAKDRSAAAGPSPSLAFEVGPRTRVVFRKRW